jgi:hypothetical protein
VSPGHIPNQVVAGGIRGDAEREPINACCRASQGAERGREGARCSQSDSPGLAAERRCDDRAAILHGPAGDGNQRRALYAPRAGRPGRDVGTPGPFSWHPEKTITPARRMTAATAPPDRNSLQDWRIKVIPSLRERVQSAQADRFGMAPPKRTGILSQKLRAHFISFCLLAKG